jgi:cytoskeletal protein CcmA (bactofilin family)
MAEQVTVIGRAARLHGRVFGDGDFAVEGFVSGEITVSGNVTVDAAGMVGATIRGRRLVVRGAVQGDLIGAEAVVLEDGARVLGDVRAPRVAIAEGALMRGHVQTGKEDGAAIPAARMRPASKAEPAPLRAEPVQAKPAMPPKQVSSPAAARPLPNAAARRPPPPVVPVMKKVKGQIIKKKER